jgi:hypothetical protein
MYMKSGSNQCIGMMKAQKQPLNTTANYWITTNIGWVTKHKVLSLLTTTAILINVICNVLQRAANLTSTRHACYNHKSITLSITGVQLN